MRQRAPHLLLMCNGERGVLISLRSAKKKKCKHMHPHAHQKERTCLRYSRAVHYTNSHIAMGYIYLLPATVVEAGDKDCGLQLRSPSPPPGYSTQLVRKDLAILSGRPNVWYRVCLAAKTMTCPKGPGKHRCRSNAPWPWIMRNIPTRCTAPGALALLWHALSCQGSSMQS